MPLAPSSLPCAHTSQSHIPNLHFKKKYIKKKKKQIEGLLMQGGAFTPATDSFKSTHSMTLSSLKSTAPATSLMPTCYVAFVNKGSNNNNNNNNTTTAQARGGGTRNSVVSVPVFYSTSRKQLLCCLDVPCKPEHKEDWLLTGLAMFLTHKPMH